ncbi:Protease 2-like protein [Drosera capensis]
MRHMDMYMEQEEKYREAVLSETERLQSKLLSEIASRLAPDLSTPSLKWGPWRMEEGKQFPVLCRRLASLNQELISNKSPSAGFDFATGKKIEQALVSEVSADHHHIAYTMYDKENDFFKLCARDLNTKTLCDKPQADRVANVAWAKSWQALLYVVTDQHKRPCKLYCCMLGSSGEDILLIDEPKDSAYINIRHTKDFRYVLLLDSADPFSGIRLVWEGEAFVHCIVEHHHGYLFLFTDAAKEGQLADNHYLLRSPVGDNSGQRKWEHVFVDDPELIIQDVDFCDSHLVLSMRKDKKLQLCAVPLPLPDQKEPLRLEELSPWFLPLPKHVSEISPGPNYDYLSSTIRFTISSPVMHDAIVDYDLSPGKWTIVQQQNLLHDRTRILYGKGSSSIIIDNAERVRSSVSSDGEGCELGGNWNDLSEFYACEYYDVASHDGVMVPLTIGYSNRTGKGDQSPALLHGHGAYGELLDKRWRSDLKSLLDRGWRWRWKG